MDALTTTLGTLSAMVTPAVLVSGSGSLLLTTSQRLARLMERTRSIVRRLEQLETSPTRALLSEERSMLLGQLRRSARRARVLQRVMTFLYGALGAFVATTVAVGVMTSWVPRWPWIPLICGLSGAVLLLVGSVYLIFESQIALRVVDDEMTFLISLGEHHARLAGEHDEP